MYSKLNQWLHTLLEEIAHDLLKEGRIDEHKQDTTYRGTYTWWKKISIAKKVVVLNSDESPLESSKKVSKYIKAQAKNSKSYYRLIGEGVVYVGDEFANFIA